MYEYALILLSLLLVTVFLHRRYKVKIFRSKSHLLISYAILLLVGISWDHFAIARGHWYFNEEFLLGVHLGLIPIEEYAFMIIVPYFGIVIYKLTEKHLKQ